jgi:hypothetical protein
MGTPAYNFDQGGFGQGGFGQGGFGGSPLTLDYYQGLLTSQYQLSPNMNAYLTGLMGLMFDIVACAMSFQESFDLSTAVGNQLDILGIIVGVSREVDFTPSDGVSPTLTDDVFRTVIQAAIGFNQWNGQVASLQTLWQQLFPGGTIIVSDLQSDMSCDIYLTGSFSSILQDLIQNGKIIPRPQTVQFNYIFASLPAFGFDLNDSFVAGFDTGKWS